MITHFSGKKPRALTEKKCSKWVERPHAPRSSPKWIETSSAPGAFGKPKLFLIEIRTPGWARQSSAAKETPEFPLPPPKAGIRFFKPTAQRSSRNQYCTELPPHLPTDKPGERRRPRLSAPAPYGDCRMAFACLK